jgi:Spy/CpxP family protein refolding chaperone
MAGRHLGEPMLDRPLLLAFRRLDLNDQQWQRVQAILEVQHLRRGAGVSPQERRAQIAALFDPGDPHHSQAVQATKDRAVARIDQAAHAQQALYEVLTPAQKTQLQQLVAQRRERMQQRLQRQGERGTRRGGEAQGQDGADTRPPTSAQ